MAANPPFEPTLLFMATHVIVAKDLKTEQAFLFADENQQKEDKFVIVYGLDSRETKRDKEIETCNRVFDRFENLCKEKRSYFVSFNIRESAVLNRCG